MRKLLNIKQGEFTKNDMRLLDEVYPDDRHKMYDIMSDFAKPNTEIKEEFRFQPTTSASLRWYKIQAHNIVQPDGLLVLSCLSDITAEKEAEIALRHSRELYENAIEAAKLSIWEYDIAAHRITMAENDFTKYDYRKFGLPKVTENAPEALLPYIDENYVDEFLEMYRKIEQGEPQASCEVWYKLKPGSEPRCERIIYNTEYDSNGKPVIAHGIGQNITLSKFEEEKYSKIIQELINSNSKALGTFRLNLTKNWCGEGKSSVKSVMRLQNAGTADAFFESASKLIEDNAIQNRYIENFNRGKLLEDFRNGKTHFTLEYPSRTVDGGWVMVSFDLVQNPATGDVEAITYANVITERKKNQQIIQRVTNDKCDYIALVNIENEIFEFKNVSKNIKSILTDKKYEYSKCIDYGISHFVDKDDIRQYVKNTDLGFVMKKLEDKPEFTFTYFYNKDGRRLRKQLQYSWLNEQKKDLLMMRVDITAVYEQEQYQLHKMKEAFNAARKADVAKSEFLSRISHDIRTPINVISSMTSFAFEDIDERPKLQDDLNKIKTSTSFLMSLINDILDISKIDSGKIEMHEEPYFYDEYIENIRNMFSPLCQEKGIEFEINDEDHEGVIMVDRVRLNQITLNLLSNAVKYTPRGGKITYTSFSEKRKDDNLLDCYIEVRDNGIGMSKEFQKKMFEPFTREERASSGSLLTENGTGLGLAIVKRLTDMMGGTLTVNSETGKGTSIKVSFVFKAATPELIEKARENAEKAESEPIVRKIGKILIAEDHPINAEITQRFLDSLGYESDWVKDGEKALEQFRLSPPDTYFAILMDIQMPVMNGYEATQKIRALKRADAHTVPIIAMTADAYAQDVQRSLDIGMNAHIAKPIDAAVLRETLENLIG